MPPAATPPAAIAHRADLPPLTREERRSLAVHAAIARRLAQAPDAVRARAHASLARMTALHPGARPLLTAWRALLDGPLEALLEVLRDPSPPARELRHVTPFTGLLSARERAQVYRAFAESERAVQSAPRAEAGRLP